MARQFKTHDCPCHPCPGCFTLTGQALSLFPSRWSALICRTPALQTPPGAGNTPLTFTSYSSLSTRGKRLSLQTQPLSHPTPPTPRTVIFPAQLKPAPLAHPPQKLHTSDKLQSFRTRPMKLASYSTARRAKAYLSNPDQSWLLWGLYGWQVLGLSQTQDPYRWNSKRW